MDSLGWADWAWIVAMIGLVQIVVADDGRFVPASYYERAPEPKPQYRLTTTGAGSVTAYRYRDSGDRGAVAVADGRFGSTAAERAVRAALDALHPEGWEEIG